MFRARVSQASDAPDVHAFCRQLVARLDAEAEANAVADADVDDACSTSGTVIDTGDDDDGPPPMTWL